MSEPVTKVEIEDVLSSIRRLVSGDERPAAAHAPDAPDRLVLTPSLRIDNAATEPPAGQPDADADLTVSSQAPADAQPARPGEGHVAEADSPSADHAPRDPKAELRARVAELEEVVSRQVDQWEPDGDTGDANSASPVAPLPWDEEADSADDVAAAAPDMTHSAGPAPQDGSVDAQPQPNDAEPRSGNARDTLAANDEFLDEDALRDLVADIVRRELQGVLGERITRNVRKLVRREIHRALASQDL
ncbi:hypothetical protein [Roseovarius dicentrarchi]|uniref:hypothetical protein n=1 Tax=Roseovarius dicentrarchi TaxID=2250573 RepID=UPI000DEBC3CC|nr:hypothetical protein [Roseovarius dicentrarchi]